MDRLHQADTELVVARDPLLLLARAAEGFLTPSPSPQPQYLLALRQGGLRDDLTRLAAAQGMRGRVDPALCIFHELPEWLGATDRRPCDDFERAVILGGVLRQLAGEVFGRLHRPEDFIAAVDQLFGELVAEGVTPEAFRAALESRHGRDPFERQRDAELDFVYREYLETLERAGRRDGRDTWLDCARAIAADPDAVSRRLGGRREIRLFGLQDLRGGWRVFLRALRACPAVDRLVIYSAEPLDLQLDPPPTVVTLEEPETIAGRLFGPAAAAKATVQVIAAPDVERELEEVARRIRTLADTGVPLTDIAVVAREARPYLDLASAALDKAGVPAAVRRRVALREVPVVRAVRSLFAAAAEGWPRHRLAELAEHPYVAAELDATVLNVAGFRRRVLGLTAWERALHELALEAEREEERRRREEDDERRRPLPPAARVRDAAAAFARFAARAASLDETRTLADWLTWLDTFLREDPWRLRERIDAIPARHAAIARLDLAGWQGVTDLVQRWRGALESWGGAAAPLTAAEFHAQLTDLLDGDVALGEEASCGVRVLEGFAAAYRSFDHVFLVGLEAGQFPLPPPASPILDEHDREALHAAGLPLEPRAAWDRRERELFRVLVAGARRQLTVSYARLDAAGREAVRSAYADALGDVAQLIGAEDTEAIPASRVVTDGIRLYASPEAAAHALRVARIEWERRTGRLSPHNGLIEAPDLLDYLADTFGDDRRWSPTQLESYAKCPWSYFSSRLLGAARLEDPDEEMDAATRGRLLHDALRRFYEHVRRRLGGPVFLRAADLGWARPLLDQALDEALHDARGTAWLGHHLLLPAKRDELRRLLDRFVAWEVEEHEAMYDPKKRNAPKAVRTGVDAHEQAFEDVVLERGGVRFRFRGTADRVEVGVDERVDASPFIAAVDYKASKSGVPGGGEKAAWDDGVVLQVPLYAYALARTRPGAVACRVEYRALKQREAVHVLELYQFDRKSGRIVPNEEAIGRMERALDHVAAHVLRARRGEFPAAPAASCGCPPFCHAREICRLPGGPQPKGRA